MDGQEQATQTNPLAARVAALEAQPVLESRVMALEARPVVNIKPLEDRVAKLEKESTQKRVDGYKS